MIDVADALKLLAWAARDPMQRDSMMSAPVSVRDCSSALSFLLGALESCPASNDEQERSKHCKGKDSKNVAEEREGKGAAMKASKDGHMQLSLDGIRSAIQLLSSFVPVATAARPCGRMLLVLLRLHAAIVHRHPNFPAAAEAALGSQAPCCVVASSAATCVLHLCSADRAAVRSELLSIRWVC